MSSSVRPRRSRWLAALALAGSACCACGTTVTGVTAGSAGAAGVAAGSGLGSAGAPGSAGMTAGDDRAGAPAAGSLGNSATGPAASAPVGAVWGPGTTTAAGVGRGTSRGAAALANGPGVTSTKIVFGYQYYTQSAAADSMVGATFDYGDPVADLKAIVKYVNSHGGVAGRQVDLDIYANQTSTNSASSFDVDAQATCDRFTQDSKVFAFAPVTHPVLRSCLGKRGVVGLGSTYADLDDVDFARTPTYIDTTGTTPQAASRNLVDALARTDYLSATWNTATGTPGGADAVKVGVLYADRPGWIRAVKGVLLPELARRGVKVDPANVFQYHDNNSPTELQDKIASIQSAVLKFRANHVTAVLPMDAAALGFFASAADRQGYRPRYGLSTAAAAQADVDAGVLPAQQLAGAVGIGWLPALDLHSSSRYAGDGKRGCLQAMKAEGISHPSGSLAEGVALAACDLILLFKHSVEAIPAGSPITAVNAAAGLESLRSSYPFSALPGGSYGPRKHFPIDRAWLWKWDSGCNCATYTSSSFLMR